MKKIVSAAVTPFTEDGRLDLESARKLYDFNIGQGCDGFFVPGSMGEWALLTREERLDLAALGCEVIGDRAAMLLNVADNGLPSILRNMELMSHLSHSHWVVVLPGKWAGPASPVTYMNKIADAADRPLYLYYIPSFNGVTISPEEFRDIVAHPRIAGLKNSAGSMRLRKELLLLKETIGFELYEGEEWSIDEALLAGCDGAVAGFGSTGMKLMKRIAACVDAGEDSGAREAQRMLIELYHGIYGDGARWHNAGQKYALQYLGVIASSRSRIEAQQVLPEEHKARVRACVDAHRKWIV